MLKIENLTKKFNERTIIDNLSFEVDDGEILTIVGPSGAGKTTLLRCISGLERVDRGQFYVDDVQFDPYLEKGQQSTIGVVFQDYQLFPNLNVLDNVILSPQLALKMPVATAKNEALDRLKRLRLDGKEQLYPYQLSGGQKQRVAIARAILSDPKLLILDDSLSAVDAKTERNIEQRIAQKRRNGTTIIAASRLSSVEHADQIIVVDNGTIIEHGTHQQLLAQHGWYADTFNLQAKSAEIEGRLNDRG